MTTKPANKRKPAQPDQLPTLRTRKPKPPQAEIIAPAEVQAPASEPFELTSSTPARRFRDAYKTTCPGCRSALMLPLPAVHCPACHKIWRSKKLSSPTRCPQCNFSLWKWRLENNIKDFSAAYSLVA